MANIHEGHRQRLKNTFLENGLNGMSSHTILELLLFFVIPRKDTNLIAHELIDRYKTISGVFKASYDDLLTINGLGSNGATFIKLIPQMLCVYSTDIKADQPMDNIKIINEYFYGCYIGVKTEQLRVCCLDDKLNIISCTVIQEGGVNAVPINVRKIVETTYKWNCSLIILSHNHPNGLPLPSDDDVIQTKKIYQILQSVGITLLDHVIVGQSGVISMKDNGFFNIFD